MTPVGGSGSGSREMAEGMLARTDVSWRVHFWATHRRPQFLVSWTSGKLLKYPHNVTAGVSQNRCPKGSGKTEAALCFTSHLRCLQYSTRWKHVTKSRA